MIDCPACGAQCESGARFCLECGEPLDAAAAPADPWLGRMVAGRFRLLEKLGDGGMGEVYRAEQLPMGRHIALKILRQSLSDDPKQVERFKREAQAASALSHPNTIIVHDFGQDTDGTLFIAMELLEGEPLNAVLEREGALSPERAAGILRQICGSLDEAHAQGLVHRDLKPENVFLTERAGANDFVKVLDFGIAKVTESGGQKLDTITQAGAIFGTPQYMAPEQIRGEGVDARADIYALGVILYEMISGHLPFAAGSVVEMLTKHLTAPPAPIVRDSAAKVDANVPRLEAIALRALSKDPTRRQQSARAFLEDIMAAMPQLSVTATTGLVPATPGGTPALDAPASGSAGKVVLIAAILAAVGVGGYFLLARNGGGGGPVDMAPAALLQPVGDNGGGGGPASAPASKAPESKAPDTAPASVAAPTSAAPETDSGPTEDEKKAAAAAEKAAEEQAKKDEEEAKKAAAEANKPMSDAEAKQIAAAAEAEAKQAAAEAKKAAAEKKAKEAQTKAKAAEAQRANALAAKANAEAEKQAAQQAAAEAKAKQAAAEAQAKEAKAKAKAMKAETEAAKAAAQAEAKKAADKLAAAQAEAQKVKAKAAEQAAQAARLKAEADALKAQLAKIEEEKAAAAAAEAEAKAKREEAKRKAAAARKKKRAKNAFAKVYIRTRTIGARISVDGKPRGVAPLRGGLRLRPGKHRVTVVSRKGKRKTQTINVKPGKVQRFRINI